MLITVVIPVYNSENFLYKCLDSIINQTYKELEIICIDDCSTDNSYNILQEYSKRDSRIKVFKNESNLKVSRTRNLGIKFASGDYIHFVDSDDWLEVDAYEILAKKLKETDVDILAFLVNRKSYDGEKTILKYNWGNKAQLNRIISVDEDLSLIPAWQTFNWNKIYKKNFLLENNCIYKDFDLGEDVHFSYITLLQSKSVYIIDNSLYNYRFCNPNSIIGKSKKCYEHDIKIFIDLYKFSQKFSTNIAMALQEQIFLLFFKTMWSRYLSGVIDYNKLRSIMIIIEEVLTSESKENYWYCYISEVINRHKWYVFIKNNIRFCLFKNYPFLKSIMIFFKSLVKN